jgi:hypothetical protein
LQKGVNVIPVIIFVVLVLVTFGVFFVMRSEQSIIRKRFSDRENISIGQFMTLLDDVNIRENCADQALRKLSSTFEIEQGKIRPDDRFDREFAPVRGSEFDPPLSTLRFDVSYDIKKFEIDSEIRIDTVRDYILFVQNICEQKERLGKAGD